MDWWKKTWTPHRSRKRASLRTVLVVAAFADKDEVVSHSLNVSAWPPTAPLRSITMIRTSTYLLRHRYRPSPRRSGRIWAWKRTMTRGQL